MNSVAFPTVGCGNLRYPVDKVARCFKTAVSATNNLKVKHFVIVPIRYCKVKSLYLFVYFRMLM